MKIKKYQMATALISIAVLLASLAIMFVNIFDSKFTFGFGAFLTFLFCLCVGFGIICFILGFAKKSSFYFFLSAILLGLAVMYTYLDILKVNNLLASLWWAGLLVLFVFEIIIAALCFMSGSNKTEAIALNERPDYKDYKTRKEEKEALEKKKPEEELPKIKSFKE